VGILNFPIVVTDVIASVSGKGAKSEVVGGRSATPSSGMVIAVFNAFAALPSDVRKGFAFPQD